MTNDDNIYIMVTYKATRNKGNTMIIIENAIVEQTGKGQAEVVGEMKMLTLTIGDWTWNVEVPLDEFNEATK